MVAILFSLSLDVCIVCLSFLAHHVTICTVFLSIYHNKIFQQEKSMFGDTITYNGRCHLLIVVKLQYSKMISHSKHMTAEFVTVRSKLLCLMTTRDFHQNVLSNPTINSMISSILFCRNFELFSRHFYGRPLYKRHVHCRM